MKDSELRAHLDRIEDQLDEVLCLLRPVHAHAGWVNSLRETLHRWRLLPRGGALFLSGEKKRKCSHDPGNRLCVENTNL